MVACDPRHSSDRLERGGSIRRFHLAATRRSECLPAVPACAGRRKSPVVELRPCRQRPVDSACRNPGDRRLRQDAGRLAQIARGARSGGRQRARRSRMRGASLASQSDHRRGARHRHRGRRLYRGSGVADADGARRSHDGGQGPRRTRRSPRPRAPPPSERQLRSPARRGRCCVADGARRRSHVDADPGGCLLGDPRRADADIGHAARHQFSLRGDRRRCSHDPRPGDDCHAPGASPLATSDEAGRAFGVVAPDRRKGRHCADESRGWLADRPLARGPLQFSPCGCAKHVARCRRR